LERRYETFTNLKTKIEELYNREKLPVVLIAHSMGNRLIQYLLTWMYTYNPDWVSKYIERYIAISPPWIGAPQAIYRLSDSDILLPAGKLQVALKGMKDVLQSFSSMPWLLPLQNEVGRYEYFNTEFFGYYAEVDSPNLDDYLPITVEETLEKAQAEDTTLVYQTIYYRDDLYITRRNSYIGSALIKCPPVNKLDVIYSTGFDTPVGAYYHFTDDKKLQIATKWGSPEVPEPFPHNTDLVIKQGIILETPKTEQKIQAEFPDHDPISNSGDSVVPYGSLAYFKKWKNLEPYRYIEGHQFSGDQNLNHNAIVSHPDVITKIIELLSKEDAED